MLAAHSRNASTFFSNPTATATAPLSNSSSNNINGSPFAAMLLRSCASGEAGLVRALLYTLVLSVQEAALTATTADEEEEAGARVTTSTTLDGGGDGGGRGGGGGGGVGAAAAAARAAASAAVVVGAALEVDMNELREVDVDVEDSTGLLGPLHLASKGGHTEVKSDDNDDADAYHSDNDNDEDDYS